jgi:hypothetical protein
MKTWIVIRVLLHQAVQRACLRAGSTGSFEAT